MFREAGRRFPKHSLFAEREQDPTDFASGACYWLTLVYYMAIHTVT
jgi:hypothetical protein